MNSRLIAVAWMAATLAVARAEDGSFKAPDEIVLKDGRVIRGLIIKNSVDSVLLQEKFSETLYPKSEIVRIRDEANVGVEFSDLNRVGELPAWRVIVNDLRTHDTVTSLMEIPATVIDVGVFKNVPYKSFRVNDDVELNIFGDPEDPAGIELGIYGARSSNTRLRRMLRGYLAGFLNSREEVAALYAIGLEEGIRDTKHLTIEVTPKDAPDAYGAWWVSLFNRKALDRVRLSDRAYAKLTRPMSDVIDASGRVRPNVWTDDQMNLSRRMDDGEQTAVLIRGFYRDKNGNFHLAN